MAVHSLYGSTSSMAQLAWPREPNGAVTVTHDRHETVPRAQWTFEDRERTVPRNCNANMQCEVPVRALSGSRAISFWY